MKRLALLVAIAACGSSPPPKEPAQDPAAQVPDPQLKGIPQDPATPAPPETPPDAETVDAPAGDTQAAIAARANQTGIELMKADKYADATAKFRDAVARVPEPRYYLNLCTSLFMEGRFSEAKTACHAGKKANPPPALAEKLDKLDAKIDAEAKAQGINLTPGS